MTRHARAVVKVLATGAAAFGLVLAMGAVPAARATQQAAGVRAARVAAGTWRNAIEVPGLAALNTGGSAGVGSVSCTSAGRCSAGGSYSDGLGEFEGFVVSES